MKNFHLALGKENKEMSSILSTDLKKDLIYIAKMGLDNDHVFILVRSQYVVILLGESCGQGTLIKLRQRIEEKGFDYVCYDVFGDPRNPSQVPSLTACAMGIINSVQQGVCVCVCVRACVRACVHACVRACMRVCLPKSTMLSASVNWYWYSPCVYVVNWYSMWK